MSKSDKRKDEDRKIAKLEETEDPIARLQAMKKAGLRVVNKPPEWPYWNRVATVTRHQAICLTLNLDPRTYYSSDVNSRRYHDIYDIVGSHIASASLRFLNRNARTFRVTDWLIWLQRIDIPIPEGWRPIGLGLKLDNQPVTNDGPCWTESVNAAIQMRDDADVNTPRTQQELYEYMLENRKRFTHCCPASVRNVEAIKQRVYRERKDESKKDPLKDFRFLNAS